MLPIYKPYLTCKNLEYAHEALNSTWISSKGKYIEEAQEMLRDILKVKYVLLTNNGTSAMHLVARITHRLYPEKRNLVTGNNHYVAAWNVWECENHYNITAIDAHEDTWNMDTYNLPADHWSMIISVVHNLGNVVDVSALIERYPKAIIVEDACEAFGGFDSKGVPAGTRSFASAFSFYGNKNITSGEGGAFVTNDDTAFDLAKKIWGQGQTCKKFIHDELGYNYRMTNVQAAILYGQLKDFNEIMGRKGRIWHRYKSGLDGWVQFQEWEQNSIHSKWMFGIRIPDSDYDTAEKFFEARGIEIRPMFYPITRHEHYKQVVRSITKIATLLNRECIILPSYPELTAIDQDYVIDIVKAYVESI